MNFTEYIRNKDISPSALEESVYEFIALELDSGQVKQGLWTKALADADWDELRAKAAYVKMRLAQVLKEVLEEERRHAAASDPLQIARQAALEFGLTAADIELLGIPIKGIDHIRKYRLTKDELALACAKKRIPAVMHAGVLWVSDRPL